METMRIGVDLGGTKIEAVALEKGGRIVSRLRRPTPRDAYRDVLQQIAELVRQVEAEVGCQASVGIGIPGSLHPETGRVRNANLQIINGQALDQDLAVLLGRPVRVANDANCFALSEASDGAGRGARVVFGVILGTGCGGGVVFDGTIWNGRNSLAGEWGHNRLADREGDEYPGPACYCGRRGCIETFVSGTALERDLQGVTGQKLSAREITQLAEQGDPQASAAVARLELRLAKALASVINLLDPDAIVLGGGLSNVARLYETVPQLWAPYIFGEARHTRLVKAEHGDSSGVRGAAWLWPLV